MPRGRTRLAFFVFAAVSWDGLGLAAESLDPDPASALPKLDLQPGE
jgi:hypothetical protein